MMRLGSTERSSAARTVCLAFLSACVGLAFLLAQSAPALAQTFVFDASGQDPNDLAQQIADGERAEIICLPDAGSGLGGFVAVDFIEIATGDIVSRGVTDTECDPNDVNFLNGDLDNASVVDDNLDDVFSVLVDGDIFRAFGIPDFVGNVANCADCLDRVAAAQARLDRIDGLIAGLQGLRERAQAGDPDALAQLGVDRSLPDGEIPPASVDGVNLDRLRAKRDQAVAQLLRLRARNPRLNSLTPALSQNSPEIKERLNPENLTGDPIKDAGTFLFDAEIKQGVNQLRLRETNRAGKEATEAFTQEAGKFLLGVALAAQTGGVSLIKAADDFLDTAFALAQAAQLAQNANQIEAEISVDQQNLILLKAIDQLNAAIAKVEVEARVRQQLLFEAAVNESADAQLEALNEQRRQAAAALRRAKARCPAACFTQDASLARGASSGFTVSSPAVGALDASSLTAKELRRLNVRFNLRDWRANRSSADDGVFAASGAGRGVGGLLGDERFNLFASSSVTLSDDDGVNGQDGETYAFSLGFSWLATETLNLGLAGSYAHVDIDGRTGDMEGSAWSLAAFAQTVLTEDLFLDGAISYGFSELDASFINGAVVSRADGIDATALAGQLKLSTLQNFDVLDVSVYGSTGFSRAQRDSFTDSNGQFSDDNDDVSFNASGGGSLSRRFSLNDGYSLTPSVNASAFRTFDSNNVGVALGSGFSLSGPGGISFGLNVGMSGLTTNSERGTLAATFSMPLN